MFMQPKQLTDLINSYVKDACLLREQIVEICYYMKGGIELESAWGMSFEDREIAIKVINKKNKEEHPSGQEYM